MKEEQRRASHPTATRVAESESTSGAAVAASAAATTIIPTVKGNSVCLFV
jgi:hypothetical protein